MPCARSLTATTRRITTTTGSKSVAVVDHTYNCPRPNDQKVPHRIASALKVPHYNSQLVGCGGNMMVDGKNGQASDAHASLRQR